MITCTASQHFFSSVPADLSPNRKSGYQTILRTPTLTPEVVRQIEDHCIYHGGEDSPHKWQFYPLPGSLFAISHTVALAERDEFGRKGRYLAHTLVINADTLRQLDGCPLDIVTKFPFVMELKDAFSQTRSGSWDVNPVQIRVEPEWRSRAQRARSTWPPNLLKQLGRLAWQAQRLQNERVSTAVNGSDEDILDLLSVLFALAGPHQRPALSFDTWARDCDWGPGVYFWLQRFPDGEKGRLMQSIDPGAHRLNGVQLTEEISPYGRWAEQDIWAQNFERDSLQQFWAIRLENILAKPGASALEPEIAISDKRFIARFAEINRAYVVRAWTTLLPPGLSPDLLNRICAPVATTPDIYLEILNDRIPNAVHEWLLARLYALQFIPGRADRAILEKYIRDSAPFLANVVFFWAKKAREWAGALSKLNQESYEYIISAVLNWPDPPLVALDGLVTPHVDTWLRLVVPRIKPKEWRDVLDQLANIGENALNGLANYPAALQPGSHAEIIHWLEKYKGRVTALRAAFPADTRKKRGFFH